MWSKSRPSTLTVWPNSPMSGRVKMIQMVPITFHGMSSGSASSTRLTEAFQPERGMARAMATPSGISISSTMPEKSSWRPSASCRRSSLSVSLNHSVPTK